MCSILFYAYCVLTLALEGQGYFFYSLYVFLQKRGKDTDFAGKEMCFYDFIVGQNWFAKKRSEIESNSILFYYKSASMQE